MKNEMRTCATYIEKKKRWEEQGRLQRKAGVVPYASLKGEKREGKRGGGEKGLHVELWKAGEIVAVTKSRSTTYRWKKGKEDRHGRHWARLAPPTKRKILSRGDEGEEGDDVL